MTNLVRPGSVVPAFPVLDLQVPAGGRGPQPPGGRPPQARILGVLNKPGGKVLAVDPLQDTKPEMGTWPGVFCLGADLDAFKTQRRE
jgi:hypothetical protein